ncbi:MAG: epoxide hydrolase [Pseudomonadaceae bacterium]|nr:epoxide hydrolase [Pseudomonadaceae bacterium]
MSATELSVASINDYRISVPQAALDDLAQRLDNTRWPETETVDDWTQGTPLAYMHQIADTWRNSYDWRVVEERLNTFDQVMVNVGGLDIHCLHIRSARSDATPLVMTHGWPGSVIEFLKVIEPLTAPPASEPAFHLVLPSLPGYGFSGKPTETGWGLERIALAWDAIMKALGYSRYLAQGGDWGSGVTTAIAIQCVDSCIGIHTNMPNARPDLSDPASFTDREKTALAAAKYYQDWDSGYSKQQSTRPQSVGYGLVDSPIAQAAWIIEKFWRWMDCDGHPENVLSRTELLDNVMMYWLTASGASSARLYWESFSKMLGDDVHLPTACSIFPKEIFPLSRRWAETRYRDIVYWNEPAKGGHFAAFEQPETFTEELRRGLSAVIEAS